MEPHPDLTISVIRGLGWLYLLMSLLNICWTFRSHKHDGYYNRMFGIDHLPKSMFWAIYSALLLVLAAVHLVFSADASSFLLRLPSWFKVAADTVIANPISFFCLSLVIFIAIIALRKWWVQPTVAWILFNLSVLFLAVSMTDYDFRQIVGKPDNVPIVGMLYLVGFTTWLYFYKANDNDERIAEGRPLAEKELSDQVLVWPDLVYSEMICMILVTSLLIVWGVALQAPLEEPASAVKTPNPSKAPWYFLGLQEMLVYYDPWMAGVVLPSVILVGLMAIPYIDFNTKGNGYYTFDERKFAIITFLFGFLPLWVGMIVLGTFIRGPNWNMFGLYEYWDVHKLEVLNNVNLSEYFWHGLGQPLPKPDAEAPGLSQVLTILSREWLGILLTLAYLFVLPPLMAVTVFKKFYVKMGFVRYMVLANLVLLMASLPLKMVLRWVFRLKYIVAIPEWFFNI
ncbi:hypothetical protein KOR42_06710 [Thalassoglobus neptunius]|uniref:Cytochrome b/b6 C-terminal region profile domain-containing protein n=1 Tax=Thalassoglobus neptunius TaxID=1938619 RepID=A0A5C5X4R3_9PLAN|nr:hypothetical protein [Thalassoglobus neptunius]TWT57311.1 hypothetical protein KOR42_06710 [Thalassoglobus neptunius]